MDENPTNATYGLIKCVRGYHAIYSDAFTFGVNNPYCNLYVRKDVGSGFYEVYFILHPDTDGNIIKSEWWLGSRKEKCLEWLYKFNKQVIEEVKEEELLRKKKSEHRKWLKENEKQNKQT